MPHHEDDDFAPRKSVIDPMPVGTLEFWQKYILEWAGRKGWNDFNRSFDEWTALFHTEISEAYEDYRNHHLPNEIYYETDKNGNQKPCGIPIELADEMIRLLHFFAMIGVDANQMIAMKMAYNEKRPYRHGDKKA